MRVIVLGGAGDVGSRTVEELAEDPYVTHLTIADRNEAQGMKILATLTRRLPEKSLCFRSVDAMNHADLVEAIKGHNVCASALGPFHLFEVRCARASIEAGVDYCSVCDDWNAAADVIDELTDAAKEKGITVVTGFGATPGTSNMGAAYMASNMDMVSDIEISCYQPLNAGGGEAVLRHMLFVMSGMLPVWKDGRKQHVKACSKKIKVSFPRYGDIKLWNMGHAEPVTMHRFMPSVQNVEYRMGFGTGSELLVWPAYLGLFRFRFFVWLVVMIFSLLDRIMRRWPKGLGAIRVDVYGMKGGQRAHDMMCGIGEMREVTGVSLACGAILLGQRRLTVRTGGVFSPEGCMDPKAFLYSIMQKGFSAFHDLEMKHKVTDAEFSL